MAEIYKRKNNTTGKESKYWWCKYSVRNPKTGKKEYKRESTGETARKAAEEYAIKREEQIRKVLHQGTLPEITLSAIMEEYSDAKGRFLASTDTIENVFFKLLDFFGEDYVFSEIDTREFQKYKNTQSFLMRSTWNRQLNVFRSLYNFTKDSKYNVADVDLRKFRDKEEPPQDVYIPYNKLPKYLEECHKTEEEIVIKNNKFINRHLYKFTILALLTSQREKDLVAINAKDIDFENKILNFGKVKSGKNHAMRIFPLLEKALVWMVEEANEEGYLIHFRGQRIKKLRRSYKNALKRAGVELPKNYNGVHALRHTAGSMIVAKTDNMKLAQEVLGHANIRTTQRYVHFIKDPTDKISSVWDNTLNLKIEKK